MIKILRGSDTSQITLTPTIPAGLDVTGAKLVFEIGSFTKEFEDFSLGVTFSIPKDFSSRQPIGRKLATWKIVWPSGKTIVTENTFPVFFTDVVEDAASGSASIVFDVSTALEGLTLDKNASSAQLLTILAQAFKRLGGTVLAPVIAAIILLSSAVNGYAASVTKKTPSEFRPNVDSVVTDVDLTGISASVSTNDVIGVVTQTVDKAYVEALGITGGGSSDVVSVNGKTGSVVITASDLSAVTWGERLTWRQGTTDYYLGINTNVNGLAFERVTRDRWPVSSAGTFVSTVYPDGSPVMTSNMVSSAFASKEYATNTNAKAESALFYSSGIYAYMTANTNAWFEGTNYNTNAEQAALKVKYSPEEWEDVTYTPPSLQLYEIRDGSKRCVWDQRDWTVYYWNFKSSQLSNNLASAITDIRTNYMRRGWAKYTAVNGLDNPATDTLWVDTPKVTLFAGHQWEKLVETGGAGYYTITGNGVELSAADADSTYLTIKDFEGNACLTFRKTSSYLVYCECGTDITRNFKDSSGRVVFHVTTDVQPTAEFSTVLEGASFVDQDSEGCPADCEWTGSAGNWDCHFLLKDGIDATSCFARFKVLREGENVIEHTVPIKLNSGIAFDQGGVTRKIKPVISGSTVNWVIVQ